MRTFDKNTVGELWPRQSLGFGMLMAGGAALSLLSEVAPSFKP